MVSLPPYHLPPSFSSVSFYFLHHILLRELVLFGFSLADESLKPKISGAFLDQPDREEDQLHG